MQKEEKNSHHKTALLGMNGLLYGSSVCFRYGLMLKRQINLSKKLTLSSWATLESYTGAGILLPKRLQSRKFTDELRV